MSLKLLLALLALGSQPVTSNPQQIREADVVGIWKMCYEPGLPGASEPSSGYLVLMPGGRYFETRVDCCEDQTPVPRSGTYTVSAGSVVLQRWKALRFVPAATVVLFDDLKGTPATHLVLAHEKNLNYGFARVYPAP